MQNKIKFDGYKVITHKGMAHADEVSWVALILGLFPWISVVLRRDPTQEEIDDPRIFVGDVGMVDDATRNCFEHHQLPADAAPSCTFTRFLAAAGIDDVFRAAHSWVYVLEFIDSKGPFAAAKELGITPDILFKTMGGLQSGMVSQFAKYDELTPRDSLFTTLQDIGRDWLEQASVMATNEEWLDKNAGAITIDDVPGILVDGVDIAALHMWREKNMPGAAFSLSHDERGEGWCLYRFDDDERLNFRQQFTDDDTLAKMNNHLDDSVVDAVVLFAHPAGFLQKTHQRITQEALAEHIRKSIVKS